MSFTRDPQHVVFPLAIAEACKDEQQIGEPVQVDGDIGVDRFLFGQLQDGDFDGYIISAQSPVPAEILSGGTGNCNDADGDGWCDPGESSTTSNPCTSGINDNCPFVANTDQTDTDSDGAGDICDLCPGFNDNLDCNANGVPDGCEPDCNTNGIPDDCDIDPTDPDGNGQTSPDSNTNTIPDECEPSIAAVFSSLDHLAAGFLSIDLTANNIEPRLRGISRLEFEIT